MQERGSIFAAPLLSMLCPMKREGRRIDAFHGGGKPLRYTTFERG
jgi:hypothetical protein